MPRLMSRATAVAALALVGGACSDAGPSNMAQVSFNLATQPAPAAVKGVAFADVGTPETFTDGSNTLVINQVELVLREIELQRAGVTSECSDISDDCEKLEVGPVLLDVPLGTTGAARTFSVELAPDPTTRSSSSCTRPPARMMPASSRHTRRSPMRACG